MSSVLINVSEIIFQTMETLEQKSKEFFCECDTKEEIRNNYTSAWAAL